MSIANFSIDGSVTFNDADGAETTKVAMKAKHTEISFYQFQKNNPKSVHKRAVAFFFRWCVFAY